MRDRRTAEAEQAEDTNNIILTCCVVPTFANSHGISQRCSLVGQQGMNSAKGEGHPAAHSTAGSSCEGAAQQQAISGAATIHWVLRGGQHRGPVHQGCKQAGPGPATRAHTRLFTLSECSFSRFLCECSSLVSKLAIPKSWKFSVPNGLTVEPKQVQCCISLGIGGSLVEHSQVLMHSLTNSRKRRTPEKFPSLVVLFS